MKKLFTAAIIILLSILALAACGNVAPPTSQELQVYHTVSYTVDGAPYHSERILSGAISTSPTPPTKEGYTFSGWFEDESGTKKYDFSAVTSDITLYAVWTKNIEHFSSVTFENVDTVYDGKQHELSIKGAPDGAEITYSGTTSAINAGVYTATALITKDGYEALTLTATLTINKAVYDMSGITFPTQEFGYDALPHSIEINGDLPIGVTVSYSGNGGIAKGSYDVIASFFGDSENYEPIPDMHSVYMIVRDPSITNRVAFDTGFELSIPYVDVVLEEFASEPNVTRLGYDLVGWYNGENKWSFDEDAVTEDITLVAKWELITYTISYVTENASLPTDAVTEFNVTDDSISLPVLDKKGYSFEGWYTDASFKNAIHVIYTSKAENITVYAKFATIEYSINYIIDGGENNALNPSSYNVETSLTELNPPKRSGYIFCGWYSDELLTDERVTIGDGTIGDITLYAKWELAEYSISYVLGAFKDNTDNPTGYNVHTETITLAHPTEDGRIFLGWYLDNEYTSPISAIAKGTTGDITVYGKWSYVYYDITYNLGIGVSCGDNPTSFNCDTPEITLADGISNGYKFLGWYDTPQMSGDRIYTINTDTLTNHTLYAKWEIFKVTYEAGVGELPSDAITTFGRDMLPLYLPVMSKDGYVFGGWYQTPDFAGYSVKKIFKNTTYDVTYYAKWIPIDYTITYVLGGGTNSSNNITSYNALYESSSGSTVVLYAPSYERHYFAGWYLDQEFTQPISKFDVSTFSDVTVYAKWEEIVVRYSDFGKKIKYADLSSYSAIVGDGITDDSQAIYNAHEWANLYAMKIEADEGKVYYFGEKSFGKTIKIKIDTNFKNAKFIIDDTKLYPYTNGRTSSIIQVSNTSDYASYSISKSNLKNLSFTKGQENIGMTFNADVAIKIVNSNKKIYIRYGANANSGGDQSELIVVDKNGNVDPMTRILWNYDTVTSMTVYPINPQTLTVENAVIVTKANQLCTVFPEGSSYLPMDQYYYYSRNINVSRSNVVVSGIEHYIENEQKRLEGGGYPYSGFFSVSSCTNVLFADCVMTGHTTYIEDRDLNGNGIIESNEIDKGTHMGTYDIGGSYANNVTWLRCRQSNSITDQTYWGVMGTNYCKNLTFDSSYLSRFDAHCGVYNATIKNSTVGFSINAIGAGTFLIENSTKLTGNAMVSLRSDYGSTWNGEIIIKNSRLEAYKTRSFGERYDTKYTTVYIASGSWTDHYFGYVCYVPRIVLDGFLTDATLVYAYNYSKATEASIVSPNNPLVLPKDLLLYYKPDNYKLYVGNPDIADGSGAFLVSQIPIKRVSN